MQLKDASFFVAIGCHMFNSHGAIVRQQLIHSSSAPGSLHLVSRLFNFLVNHLDL